MSGYLVNRLKPIQTIELDADIENTWTPGGKWIVLGEPCIVEVVGDWLDIK